MFCDTCHWYTRGEAICPHCGAPQGPAQAEEIVSLLEEPAPLPEVPASPPEPSPLPAPAPPPAPPPAPVPKPASQPVPTPPPKPAPSVPKPAPTPSEGNKQGFKALALILAGTVVLILGLLFAEMAREDTYYTDTPDYDDSYFYDNFYYDMTEIALEEAQVGDVVSFGNAQWRVLDKGSPDALLLLEYEIYLQPGEIYDYLSDIEAYDDIVWLGGVEFSREEFDRIVPAAEGAYMFQLSLEEMEQYGIHPPEIWDDEIILVQPAIWVNI